MTRRPLALALAVAAGLAAQAVLFACAAPAHAAVYWNIRAALPTTKSKQLFVGIGKAGRFAGFPVKLSPRRADPGQQWRLVRYRFSLYILINRASGQCMDIEGPSEDFGTRVHQWDCYPSASQIWQARTGAGRPVDIETRTDRPLELGVTYGADHRCLDVTEYKFVPGTLLQVWGCPDFFKSNQRFYFTTRQ